jgi:hypothetical protein
MPWSNSTLRRDETLKSKSEFYQTQLRRATNNLSTWFDQWFTLNISLLNHEISPTSLGLHVQLSPALTSLGTNLW